jgi:hypothetical protein
VQRLITTLCALLILTAPALSQPQKPAKPSPTARPIDLKSPGAQPQQALHYTFKQGASYVINVELKSESTDTSQDGKEIKHDKATTRFSMNARVGDVLKDGSALLRVNMVDLEKLDADGKPVELKGFAGLAASMLKSASGSCIVGPDGQIRSAAIGDGTHANYDEFVFQPITFLFVPLPSDPIGPNANWTAIALAFRDTKIVTPKTRVPDDIETLTLVQAVDNVHVSRSRAHAEAPEMYGGNFIYDRMKDLAITLECESTLSGLASPQPQSASAIRSFDGDDPATLIHSHMVMAWDVHITPAADPKPPAPPNHADAKSAEDLFHLDVTATGFDPKISLAPNPKPGDRATYDLVIRGGESMADDDSPRPVKQSPGIGARFEFTIKEVNGKDVRADIHILSTSLMNPDEVTEAERAAMKDMLSRSVGKTCTCHLSTALGSTQDNAITDESLDFLSVLPALVPQLPTAPIGRAGRWRIRVDDPKPRPGVKLATSSEHVIVAVNNGLWTIESNESARGTQPSDDDGSPLTLSTTIFTTTKLRPGSLLPDELHQKMIILIKDTKHAATGLGLRKEASIHLIRLPENTTPAK